MAWSKAKKMRFLSDVPVNFDPFIPQMSRPIEL